MNGGFWAFLKKCLKKGCKLNAFFRITPERIAFAERKQQTFSCFIFPPPEVSCVLLLWLRSNKAINQDRKNVFCRWSWCIQNTVVFLKNEYCPFKNSYFLQLYYYEKENGDKTGAFRHWSHWWGWKFVVDHEWYSTSKEIFIWDVVLLWTKQFLFSLQRVLYAQFLKLLF